MALSDLLRHISVKRVRLQKAQALMTVTDICLEVVAIVSIGIVDQSVVYDLAACGEMFRPFIVVLYCVQGRYAPYPVHDPRQDAGNVVDLLFGVPAPQRKAQGTPANVVRNAHCQKHVRRLPRVRRAG